MLCRVMEQTAPVLVHHCLEPGAAGFEWVLPAAAGVRHVPSRGDAEHQIVLWG